MDKTKEKDFRVAIIACLILCVLVMTVGYAALAQRLTVTGNTNVTDASWNVKLTELRVIDKSITGEESIETAVGDIIGTPDAINIAGNTTATFNVKLNAPGDYVEFKVGITNLGTIDAKLDTITDLAALNNENPKVVKYTVTEMASNEDVIQNKDTHYFIVRVEWYKNEVLVDENATVGSDGVTVDVDYEKTATIHFDYIQG